MANPCGGWKIIACDQPLGLIVPDGDDDPARQEGWALPGELPRHFKAVGVELFEFDENHRSRGRLCVQPTRVGVCIRMYLRLQALCSQHARQVQRKDGRLVNYVFVSVRIVPTATVVSNACPMFRPAG